MAGCLSKNSSASATSTYKKMINDEQEMKQGILVSPFAEINSLSSSSTSTISSPSFPPPNPLRRTLSADMSSQRWLARTGFSPSAMKRAQSSEQLKAFGEEHDDQAADHDDDDDEQSNNNNEEKGKAFEDIWSNIQATKKQSWSSILSQQTNDGSGSGSGSGSGAGAGSGEPYVHPLVKRTTSSLSEKSLEICTESLGSETGSDVFSYPASDPEDSDKDGDDQRETTEVQVQVQEEEVKDYVEVVVGEKYYNNNEKSGNNYKKVTPRGAFPPPLPSLAHRDGSNLHMRSHRQGGRLVLEAVTVPSQNRFRAERHDGRLLLTLAAENDVVDPGDTDEDPDEEEEEDQVAVEKELAAIVLDHNQYKKRATREEIMPGGMINVHRSAPSALIMSKLLELTSTRNKSTWPRNHNATVIKSLDEDEDDDDDQVIVEEDHQQLPRLIPTARAAAAMRTATAVAALNAYEYYWRRSSTVTAAAAMAVLKPLGGHHQQQQHKIKNLAAASGAAAVVPQVEKRCNNMNKLLLGHNGKSVKQQQQQQQEVVLAKAATTTTTITTTTTGEKAEYLVPMLRGCKEPRKSLLFCEPHCIATS